MAQTEEFMFQNVAYRPTVYRTGMDTKLSVAKAELMQGIFSSSIYLPETF